MEGTCVCGHEEQQAVAKWCYLELPELLWFDKKFYSPKVVNFFFSSCSPLLLSYLNILCVSEKCYVLLPKGFYFCKDMSYFFLSNLLSSELSKKSSQVTFHLWLRRVSSIAVQITFSGLYMADTSVIPSSFIEVVACGIFG